jgi:hypothetical protein
VQSPLTIGELREMVFNHLETRELLNVTATSKEMQYMLQVPSIQRQLWKLPVPVKAGEDPHFQPLTEQQAQVMLPDGLTIPEAMRRHFWTYFENIKAGLPPMTVWQASFAVFNSRQADIDGLEDAYDAANPDTNVDCVEDLALYCYSCERYHKKFQPTRLHELLRFLDDTRCCIQGHGSELAVMFDLKDWNWETEAAHYHRVVVQRYLTLARQARKAYNLASQSGLLGDSATAPLCTRFITGVVTANPTFDPEHTYTSDSAGVKLGHALRQVSKFCRAMTQAQKMHVDRPIVMRVSTPEETEIFRCWYQDAENEMNRLASGWY